MIAATRALSVVLVPLLFGLTRVPQQPVEKHAAKPERAEGTLRAKYLITVTDDFVVDVYHNGRSVPDSKRAVVEETYGATAERMDIEVHRGDWLVFHIVSNRMRWGGVCYFGMAGCFAENEFGFVSSLEDGLWSSCDTAGDAEKFITKRTYFEDHPAQRIAQPWSSGTPLMQRFAGATWHGDPLWGSSRSTYVKVLVE